MKKITLLAVLIIGFSQVVMAQQPNRNKTHAKEKLEAQRVAFITSKLELSPNEAQTFWPIYNEYKRAQNQLKKSIHKPKKLKEATDTEIEQYLTKSLEVEEKQIELKRQYYQDLKKAIPVRKIARLIVAERAFTKMVVRRMNERATKHKRSN